MVAGTVLGGGTGIGLAAVSPAGALGLGPGPAGSVPGYPAPVQVPPPLVPMGQVPGPGLDGLLQGSATNLGNAAPVSQDSAAGGGAGDFGFGSLPGTSGTHAQSAAQAFERSSYNADIGGAAIGEYARVPYYAVGGAPYSEGILRKVAGSDPESESFGAGYWLGVAIEEGILGPGFSPGGTPPPVTYKNPTYARATYPRDKKYNTPSAPSGPDGPFWTASCPSGVVAQGSGRTAVINAGTASATSATTQSVSTMDRRAKTITSIVTSEVKHLLIGPLTIQDFRSYLKVVQRGNGARPTVSYVLSIAGVSNGGAPVVGVDGAGITLAGNNVPAGDLVSQFNNQVNSQRGAVSALGNYDFSFLSPQVTFTGIKTSIVSPVLAAGAGLAARNGGVGQEQGVRLGDARFDGYFITLT